MLDAHLADLDFCYVTTTGRVSGREHTVEIWFAAHRETVFILAGGGRTSDWVKNAIRRPAVTVRIGEKTFAGAARIAGDGDEDALARRLLLAKYAPRYSGDLDDWGRTALPVAIDLAPA
jgi:deazaflavin-dependent oxidoreductase (nitroreductase family)